MARPLRRTAWPRPPVETERLRLRLPRASDAAWIQGVCRQRRVQRWIPPMPRPYRLADARGFVLGARRKFRQRRSLVLVLERLADERSVGICELQVTDATNRRAELGYWVDPRWWGNGYASEGARRLCEVGFDTVGLNRIESGVLQGNERSQRLLGRLGFALEGVLRSRIRAGHGWLDERRFALLADEFDRPAQARVTLGVSRRMRDGGTTRPRPAGCFRRRSS